MKLKTQHELRRIKLFQALRGTIAAEAAEVHKAMVTGNVEDAEVPPEAMEGVTVKLYTDVGLTELAYTTLTNSDGNYGFSVPDDDYWIVATFTGYTSDSPSGIAVTISGADDTGNDFVMTED